MKNTILNSFFLIIIIYSFSCNSPSGLERIWGVDDGEKIKQEDISNPLSIDEKNEVWKNGSINIFGGRNEIIAFQLILQSTGSGAKNVNVSISNLMNGNYIIPGSADGSKDPFDYRNRNIELFTEHYLKIERRSPALWFFSDDAAPSEYYSGWVPDCLIPFSASTERGGAPFNIKPKTNQGIWVDIFIPKDALAGNYKGKATITVAEKVVSNIPINLKVYDFTLSDSTHIQNMFGYYPEAIAKRHGVKTESLEYFNLEARYFQLAHRHRFDLVTKVSNLSDMTKYYKRYYTGEIYTPGNLYQGPGENIGNITFSIGYGGSIPDEYGDNVRSMTRESWWKGSDAWENWFIQNAPGVKRHKYLFPDEPEFKGPAGAKGTGSMDTIKMQALWSHNNPGPGKNIPTFVTNRIKPILKNQVDFWSISGKELTNKISPDDVATEKTKGNKLGVYNGFRPGMGAVVSDADAIEFRVMPWIVWKYHIDQYFYWSTNYWRDKNIFVDPLTYLDSINGDGTFLYPGEDKIFPMEDRNLKGPMSSIRAKNWRRGAQDFEYLWLAKQKGLNKAMDSIVNACIPYGLWEAKSLKKVSWSTRGYAIDGYRKKLAELLSGKTN